MWHDAMTTPEGGSPDSPEAQHCPTVRVVVRCGTREAETDVPSERPIEELVPDLIRAVFRDDDSSVASQLPWSVSVRGDRPLPATTTLADHAVADGGVLQLQQVSQWEPPAAGRPPADPGHDDLLPPRQRTLAALPVRQPAVRRLAGAVAAVLSRDALPAPAPVVPMAPAPGTSVPAMQLTVPRRPGALERGRRLWRGTGYLRQLDQLIQAPQLQRCVTIAVMSPKGGVGKTTASALLGTLFALVRRDRIVAVDTNPDFGSLGRSLAPGHDVFVDDLLEVLDSPELTVTALDANLGRAAHGLMVLPVPGDPERMARLDETAYTRVVRRLQGLVGMVLLDCGAGLQGPAARAALATADQVLLVTDADPSTASLVAEAAGLLRQQGAATWLMVNRMTPRSRLQLSSLEAFVPYARGLLVLPENAAGAARVAAGTFHWRDAPPRWRTAVREVAAALAAAWPEQGIGV